MYLNTCLLLACMLVNYGAYAVTQLITMSFYIEFMILTDLGNLLM